jgi:hemolysin activation/secretion protein
MVLIAIMMVGQPMEGVAAVGREEVSTGMKRNEADPTRERVARGEKAAEAQKDSAKGQQPQGSNRPKAAPQTLETLVDQDEVYFTVVQFQVDGNSLLEEEHIQEVLRPFRGFAQKVEDVEAARLALEKTYHEAGYPTVLVVLPQQKIEGGMILLEVVESRIHNLQVTGNRFFSTDRVLAKMPSLQPGAIIHEPTLKKELGAVNAHPDRNVTPVLKPGAESGTVDLELKVNDRFPLHASLMGDNRGALNTPRNRMVAEVQYANLWDLEHILTFQTVQTPTDPGEVQVYGLTYVAPLGDPRYLLSAFASLAQTTSTLVGTGLPIGAGGTIGIAGNAKIAGFRFSFPWDTDGKVKHMFSVGVDYKRLEETTAEFPEGLGTAQVTSPIEYLPLSVGYTGILGHWSGVSTATLSFKGYVAGILPQGQKEDFGGNPADPGNPGNRVGATGTFAIIQGSLDRTQFFPSDWMLTAHLDGQWANEPLVAVEQLFTGGMDTVRGYDQFETLGDMGFRTRLELLTPNIPFRFDRTVNSWLRADIRLATFFDTGFLWVRRAQPGQPDQFQLHGTGVGIRAKLTEYLDLHVDHGWALRKGVVSEAGDSFTHFSIKLAL